LYSDEKVIWEKIVKTNFEKEYEKFQSQPTEWNGGISKLLDFLLNDQLKSLESYEPLTDITSARFEKIKLKSFICKAPDIDKRIPQEKRTSVPDICVYIYAIINVPENDSLDTITTMQINDWITNNISLIDFNSIFEFLTSFPFNYVNNNFCIITTEIIGMNKEDFDKYENKKNLIKENIKIKDEKIFSIDKLEKKNFVEVLKKKNTTKIKFPKNDDYFEDLPIDFILKCNRLVCALLSHLSKNNLNYDFELIKPEFYLIDLCSDFIQYKSLVKSVKVNFDILNEVPEENFVSMKDVYYYIYNHLI
jgi:type III secretion system FlhB-like substrate exporter